MDGISLYNEYRLIERRESEINGAWKGAHLLLFFLAFVFGSFCTFCFHMLMYLFDEKCVLFPKLLSLTSLKHNVIYEFIPSTKDLGDLPVDFLSTQWVEKSTCSLPTYVPLVSGIFGLVWTTMFLMCSTGSRTAAGLQRPWRVLPPVFVFSLAMGGLCIYSSVITHYGLQELCIKLGEITGSPTCSYTVNVATLTYERRIRGVYQATRLTILSAWLHTACWLLSALLALVRILMAVDFQLVRISVRLIGDIDRLLEKHETQIRSVSPETWINNEKELSDTHLPVRQQDKYDADDDEELILYKNESNLIYMTALESQITSELSLVPEERNKIEKLMALQNVPKDKAFIVTWIFNLIQNLPIRDSEEEVKELSSSTPQDRQSPISRQFGRSEILTHFDDPDLPETREESVFIPPKKVDSLILIQARKRKDTIHFRDDMSPRASSSKEPAENESVLNLTPDMQRILNKAAITRGQRVLGPGHGLPIKKSNLKHKAVQTEKAKKKERHLRVQISDKSMVRIRSDSDEAVGTSDKKEVDKETQTAAKEKQD